MVRQEHKNDAVWFSIFSSYSSQVIKVRTQNSIKITLNFRQEQNNLHSRKELGALHHHHPMLNLFSKATHQTSHGKSNPSGEPSVISSLLPQQCSWCNHNGTADQFCSLREKLCGGVAPYFSCSLPYPQLQFQSPVCLYFPQSTHYHSLSVEVLDRKFYAGFVTLIACN